MVAPGLVLGSSLLTSVSQIYGGIAEYQRRRQAGNSAADAYRANARLAERNAQLALQDAMAARLSTLRRVDDIQTIGRLRRGSMTAATASRGVVTNTGSPLEALAADAYETGQYAAEEHLTGMTQARSLEIEAINHKFQASYDRQMAGYVKKQARAAARVGLVQGLASGLSTSIQGFAQYKSLLAQTPSASQPMVSQWAPPPTLPFQMPPGE